MPAVIAGIHVVEPVINADERGLFVETYRRNWFPQGREMVQSNRADRDRGSVVGLHYHLHQADYWYVPFGTTRVVLHDLRSGSPTDGATLTLDLGRRGDGSHDQDERDELQGLLVMFKQHQLGHGPGEPKRKNAEDPAAQELDMIGADTAHFHVILLEHDSENCRLFG